jgi:hypothetical protein
MPDVVREGSHKSQGKQQNTAKMFHYTPAPPKTHTQKINGLARYVANVFSPYCSSWVISDPTLVDAIPTASSSVHRLVLKREGSCVWEGI